MPMFMDTLELVLVEGWIDPEFDPCGPRMIELVSPRGEQPTNEGAVSLTVAHSWILNSIASRKASELLLYGSEVFYILCWSAVSQFVARQQDRVLTYSALVQRHLTSKLEQLPADAVELLRHVCFKYVSLDPLVCFNGELTAQPGTAVRF